MPHRIAVIEDDPFVRRHLARLIDAHPELQLMGEAGGVSAGLALAAKGADRIIVDLGLPDGSGLEVIRTAAALPSPPRLLVLTVFGDETSVVEAVGAGADGYLLKDSADETLCADILETLNGGSPISASVAAYLLRRMRRGAPTLWRRCRGAPPSGRGGRLLWGGAGPARRNRPSPNRARAPPPSPRARSSC